MAIKVRMEAERISNQILDEAIRKGNEAHEKSKELVKMGKMDTYKG